MRNAYHRYFDGGFGGFLVIVVVAVLVGSCCILSGCAPVQQSAVATQQVLPTTPKEKLVAAEVGYQAVLKTTIQLSKARVIQGQDALNVKVGILSARLALNQWHDQVNDAGAMQAGLDALESVQALLTEYANTQAPPGVVIEGANP